MKISMLLLMLLLPVCGIAQISDEDAVKVFCQGRADNCASVALIKAAIYKSGYKKVFTFKKTADGITVTLRNGKVLNLMNDEISMAPEYAAFNKTEFGNTNPLANEVINYANLIYAVMAKSIEKFGVEGCNDENNHSILYDEYTYKEALELLYHPGICTDNCYKILGYTAKNGIENFTATSASTFENKRGIILYSWPHAVFVLHKTFDCYGSFQPILESQHCDKYLFEPKWFIELN